MKLMGHRGARNEVPENTLKGFEKAIELSLPAVELDIHLSNDEELMVIHDDTVDRTTNGQGKVNDLYCEALQKLDAGDGEKIPTLKEALAPLLASDVEVQIEVKDGKTLPELGKSLSQLTKKQSELITVISFHHRWLKDFKEAHPKVKTAALLYGHPLNPHEIVKACQADGISLNVSFISRELAHIVKKAGLSLTGWNANDEDTYRAMADIGLDYLGTDVPTQAINWQKAYQA